MFLKKVHVYLTRRPRLILFTFIFRQFKKYISENPFYISDKSFYSLDKESTTVKYEFKKFNGIDSIINDIHIEKHNKVIQK